MPKRQAQSESRVSPRVLRCALLSATAKAAGREGARTRAEWSEPSRRVKARRKRAARIALHHARRAPGGLRSRQVVQELLVVVAHVGLQQGGGRCELKAE